jgi:hypothetical protein
VSSTSETMIALGVLGQGHDLKLSRPPSEASELTISRLGLMVEEIEQAVRPGGPSLTLCWGEGSGANLLATLHGIIGRIVTLELLSGESHEVLVADLRRSPDGSCSVICRRRDGATPKGRYAHPSVIPNKLVIPLQEVSSIHVG